MTDSKLTDKLSYQSSDSAYYFNYAGVDSSAEGVSDPNAPNNLLKKLTNNIGTPTSTNSLYSVKISQDPSKGITYYDNSLGLNFTMTLQTPSLSPHKVGGRIIYPLDLPSQSYGVYTPKVNGLKEDILLTKPTTSQSISYAYKLTLPPTLAVKMMPDQSGDIGIYSADKLFYSHVTYGDSADQLAVNKARLNNPKTNLVFVIPSPSVLSGNKGLTADQIPKAKYSLNGTTLTVNVTNLTQRSYPLSIDPSVVVNSSSQFLSGNNEDNINFNGNQISRSPLTGGSLSAGWTTDTTAPLPSSAQGVAAVSYMGNAYTAGGYNGSLSNAVEYSAFGSNGSIAAWSATTAFMNGRQQACLLAYNGYLYILGGRGSTTDYNDVQYAHVASSGALGPWHYTYNSQDNGTNFVNGFATAREGQACAVYQGHVYIAGVINYAGNTYYSDIQYASINANGTIGTWNTSSVTLPTVRSGLGLIAYNGRMYMGGGYDGTSFYADVQYAAIYGDGSLGSWTATTNFTTARQNFHFVINGGYLYVIGGHGTGTTYYSDVQDAPIYDYGPLGNWTTTSSFVTARGYQATLANGNYVYMLGGYDGTTYYADVQYAPIDNEGRINSYSSTTSLPTVLNKGTHYYINGFSTAFIKGYVYVLGGNISTGSTTTQSTVYYATIDNTGTIGTWNTTTSLPVALYNGTAIASGGYVYYLGGNTGSANVATVYSSAISSTGTLGSWSTTTALPAATSLSATAIDQGYIYEIGGVSTANTNAVYYAAINNSTGAIGAWSSATNLTNPTEESSAIGVNGYVYLFGGYTTAATNSVEYALICTGSNSGTAGCSSVAGSLGTWTTATSLPTATYNAGAMLYDGYVYVLGGCSVSCSNTNAYSAPFNSDGSIGTWSTNASETNASAYNTQAISYGGYAYYFYESSATAGGVDSAMINNGGNGANGAWASTSSLIDSVNSASSVVYNGYIYYLGGQTTSSIEYAKINSDGTLGAWAHTTNSLPMPLFSAGYVVYNGYLYQVGGETTSTATNAVNSAPFLSNGQIGTWTALNSLPAITQQAGTVISGGYIYEIGGSNAQNSYTNAYTTVDTALLCTGANSGVGGCTSSPNTIGTWTQTTGIPTGLIASVVVTSNNYIYVLGGNNTSGNATNTVYYAKPLNGAVSSWNIGPTMPADFYFAAGQAYGGYVYIYTGNAQNVGNIVFYAPILDNGDFGGWQASGNKLSSASSGDGYASYNGYIYLLGGQYSAASNIVYYAPLETIPRIAHYSIDEDIGTAVGTLNSITYSGTIQNGYNSVNYQTAGWAAPTFGGVNTAASLPGNLTNSCSGNVDYVMVSLLLDDSYNSVFPDSAAAASNISNLTINYIVGGHPPPILRMRNGAFFDHSKLQPLDTCM